MARQTTDIDTIIGQRIRLVRKEKGVTQEQLSELIGVSFQQIQKYENGKNRISASRLFRLSKALNISLNYFFADITLPKENDLPASQLAGH